MNISFPYLDTSIEVNQGATVADACVAAGIPLNLVCGGNGTCGKCRVTVAERDGFQNSVLACRHSCTDGMRIFAKPDASTHQLLETDLQAAPPFDPWIRIVAVDATARNTPMGGYDFECCAAAIREQTGREADVPSVPILRKISTGYRDPSQNNLYLVLAGDSIIDAYSCETEPGAWAVAVDIGTTSVVAFLYDLFDGTLLGHASELNRQAQYGADVISRIDHVIQDPDGLDCEQEAIAATINDLIGQLCEQHEARRDRIYEVVCCGNSTMQHLCLGLSPQALGRMPFAGLVSREVVTSAAGLGLDVNESCLLTFMPLLGGFVGADTVACLLELPRDQKPYLVIDLGTNCEVSMRTADGYLVASTACGPALEGAGLSSGMRACDGAIETVEYLEDEQRFAIGVIGNVAAKGLCGSGIIDTVAMLLKSGVINAKGKFLKGQARTEHPLGGRIEETEGGRLFVLVDADEHPQGERVCIMLKDIRAIQLAKSAIFAGCRIVMDASGIRPEDLSAIYLAGAFGNYINVENAQIIGLLPTIEGVPIRSMGNGAGLGVQRYLLNCDERTLGERIRQQTKHIELAHDKHFTEVYVRGMTLERNVMCQSGGMR